jgi:hypothetical protein
MLQFSSTPREIVPGQLWSLRASDTDKPHLPARAPRLAVVQDVGPQSGGEKIVRLAPISVDTRYPGIYDLLVPSTESPIGCSFMVECWNVQATDPRCLDRAIGKLHDSAMQDIRTLWCAFKEGVTPIRTTGITGRAFPGIPIERQLQFQTGENEAIRNAIIPCR